MSGLPRNLRVPRPDSAYRELFEQARSESEAATIALSYGFQTARESVAQAARSRNPEGLVQYAEYLADVLSDAAGEVKEQFAHDDAASALSLSRAGLQQILGMHILVMPALYKYPFGHREVRRERAKLMDGVYGQIVEHALELRAQQPVVGEPERRPRERIGALTELAVLGIGNRNESHDHCTLPTLYQEAHSSHTMEYYGYVRSLPTGGRAPLYSKFRPKEDPKPHVGLFKGAEIGCQPYAEPWQSPDKFAVLDAMDYELQGRGEVVVGPQNMTAVEGLRVLEKFFFRTVNGKIAPYE